MNVGNIFSANSAGAAQAAEHASWNRKQSLARGLESTGLSDAGKMSSPPAEAADSDKTPGVASDEVKEKFTDFVGQTFFGQMLASMRKTVGKPAYFHGGQAEEIFRGQMDQVLAEKMTDASGEQFTKPMYELFSLRRN